MTIDYTSPELSISCDWDTPLPTLIFTFRGKLTEMATIRAAAHLRAFLSHHPDQSYVLVWDCLEMNGFEYGARKQWYRYMELYRSQIDKVIVAASSMIIRSAARVMLDVFGVPYLIVRSHAELAENVPQMHRNVHVES